MAGHHVLQRGEHVLQPARKLLVPVAQQVAHLLALQVFLAAAERAGNDGKLPDLGPADQVFLRHVGQRADHHELAVVAHQLGRHALELAAEEHVEEQRLQHVVAVVAQRDLGRAQLLGHAVQDTAAQSAAQAAHGLAFGDHLLDDGVGVLRFDVVLHAEPAQVLGQDVVGEAGLFLVEVDRDDLEVDGRTRLQLHQDVEQAITVLAPRDADHHPVAGFDHVEVHDGAADLAAKTLFQLVVFVGEFFGVHGAGSRALRSGIASKATGETLMYAATHNPGGVKPRICGLVTDQHHSKGTLGVLFPLPRHRAANRRFYLESLVCLLLFIGLPWLPCWFPSPLLPPRSPPA
ncbi:hypothetical protein Y695_02924 [Hydrogenophaga sp. T4]|nr:hypothetical protein Y695_02924 [Hydrogenophaga sp. T4]